MEETGGEVVVVFVGVVTCVVLWASSDVVSSVVVSSVVVLVKVASGGRVGKLSTS